MKLRIITSMLLVVFLSVFNSLTASAHDGCNKGGNCCHRGWHHGCWGHQGYIYGPDGYYAQHKACCEKKCAGTCEKKCTEAKSCCHNACGSYCHRTYRRAYYHEDCCGWGHLHCSGGNDCSKKCSKSKDDDDDDK